MDETEQIHSDVKRIQSLLGHEGWPIMRRKFQEKLDELKDAFHVDDSDPAAMLIDMKARKAAHILLTEILRDVEGTKEQPLVEERPDKPWLIRS